MTLVSYVPKRNNCGHLLSTIHHTIDVSEGAQRKPEIILFYNPTKGRVDSLDQKCAIYSVAEEDDGHWLSGMLQCYRRCERPDHKKCS